MQNRRGKANALPVQGEKPLGERGAAKADTVGFAAAA
jgi:hypothetical protein